MKFRLIHFSLPLIILSFLASSCGAGGGRTGSMPQGDTIPMKYAENLTMIDHGDFVEARFRNPWDTVRILQTYLLVPRDKELPKNMPKGEVVRVPLQNSVVYTSVHGSLIDELGSLDAITGVCDAKYIHNQNLRKRISDGRVADCGESMAPNIEKILMLKPDAILLSAYENSNDHNKVGQIGIPIIDCIDYMETSPLGRAEWMRFFGRLYGQEAKADSLFSVTENAYKEIKNAVKGVQQRPKVLTEMIYGQTWNVPGAYSTAGVLIEDAGGRNPFDEYKRSGSVQLAPEEVLYRAEDADFWLVKYAGNGPFTMTRMGKDAPIYTKFKPFKTGNIYGLNSEISNYFEEQAFHPHWILAEYVNLFHPEVEIPDYNHHYYSKLQR